MSPLRGKASAMGGRMSRVASGKLFVLIITNFVDMVGLLMMHPTDAVLRARHGGRRARMSRFS